MVPESSKGSIKNLRVINSVVPYNIIGFEVNLLDYS